MCGGRGACPFYFPMVLYPESQCNLSENKCPQSFLTRRFRVREIAMEHSPTSEEGTGEKPLKVPSMNTLSDRTCSPGLAPAVNPEEAARLCKTPVLSGDDCESGLTVHGEERAEIVPGDRTTDK